MIQSVDLGTSAVPAWQLKSWRALRELPRELLVVRQQGKPNCSIIKGISQCREGRSSEPKTVFLPLWLFFICAGYFQKLPTYTWVDLPHANEDKKDTSLIEDPYSNDSKS